MAELPLPLERGESAVEEERGQRRREISALEAMLSLGELCPLHLPPETGEDRTGDLEDRVTIPSL